MRKLYIETFVFFATFFSPKISHFVRKNKYAKKTDEYKISRKKAKHFAKIKRKFRIFSQKFSLIENLITT